MKYQGKFNHLVVINEQDRLLSIYRVFENGERDLYTSVALPEVDAQKDWETFSNFARTMGENLFMDSPQARKLLNL